MTSGAQVVQELLSAARSGDVEAVRERLTEDFVWHVPGSGRIAGQARGAEGLLGRLRAVVGAGVRPEVLDVLEGQGHVALLQRNTADSDGRTLDVRVVSLCAVEGGRVARMDTFFDDQAQADRFWAPL